MMMRRGLIPGGDPAEVLGKEEGGIGKRRRSGLLEGAGPLALATGQGHVTAHCNNKVEVKFLSFKALCINRVGNYFS